MPSYWLSDRAYTILKWFALIVLPAVATLIGVVAPLWGVTNATPIVSTISAVSVCIGAIIGASTSSAAMSIIKQSQAKESSEKEE